MQLVSPIMHVSFSYAGLDLHNLRCHSRNRSGMHIALGTMRMHECDSYLSDEILLFSSHQVALHCVIRRACIYSSSPSWSIWWKRKQPIFICIYPKTTHEWRFPIWELRHKPKAAACVGAWRNFLACVVHLSDMWIKPFPSTWFPGIIVYMPANIGS